MWVQLVPHNRLWLRGSVSPTWSRAANPILYDSLTHPNTQLMNGQVFGFALASPPPSTEEEYETYVGVLWRKRVELRQRKRMILEEPLGEVLWYRTPGSTEEDARRLREFLRAEVNVEELYERWSSACPRFAKIAHALRGVHLLRQDPYECLVSFICSSNNNVARITKMLQAFRREYGEEVEPNTGLYAWPSLDRLAERNLNVDTLNTLGFGYRSKFVVETVSKLRELGGESYLHELKRKYGKDGTVSRRELQLALLQFAGVGEKVADCVSLFAFDALDTIPVDTHVFQIAKRDYGLSCGNAQTITKELYASIGEAFLKRFGKDCGWAHTVLFTAELAQFKELVPAELAREMDEFKTFEKNEKAKLTTARRARAEARDHAKRMKEGDEQKTTTGQESR